MDWAPETGGGPEKVDVDIDGLGAGVRAHTVRYVEAVVDCVALLVPALRRYQSAGTLGDLVSAIDDAESACDRWRRELARTLASMPPAFTGGTVTSGQLLQFFHQVDAVANRSERAVAMLDATGPPLDDVPRLVKLGERTREAAEELAVATVAYVEALPEGDTGAVTDSVERVATLEEECDEIRQTVVRSAFEGDQTAALLVREAVLILESVTDAAEDAADTLAYLRLVGQ
jgi:uncharacterized protein Yka (UPF0111/DUF47 family)